MFIDDSAAPVVFVRSHVESNVSMETQFQKLLDKGEQFVLVSDHNEEDHHEESQEERKKRTMFIKKVKGQLRLLCRGMIVLEGDKPMPAAARIVAATAAKAFGFAIAFTSNEEEAVKLSQKLLAK